MILLIDNYDSFVHNLARYVRELGGETMVVRNDEISIVEIGELNPQAIILSPGPCTPNEAGISIPVIQEFAGKIPILGVCLGHQAIGQAMGAEVIRAPEPVHGRVSRISTNKTGLFAGLPREFSVCRYHSLIVSEATLPKSLTVSARTSDGIVMALENTAQRLFGLQFHPEAILSEHGHSLLNQFLQLAGIDTTSPGKLPHRPEGQATCKDVKTATAKDGPVITF